MGGCSVYWANTFKGISKSIFSSTHRRKERLVLDFNEAIDARGVLKTERNLRYTISDTTKSNITFHKIT